MGIIDNIMESEIAQGNINLRQLQPEIKKWSEENVVPQDLASVMLRRSEEQEYHKRIAKHTKLLKKGS